MATLTEIFTNKTPTIQRIGKNNFLTTRTKALCLQ